jgi:hypothetical protein
MNTFCTLIVTDENKDAANALVGGSVFSREATDGEDAFWYNSGAFTAEEVTALVNSDLLHYADFGGHSSGALESQSLTAINDDFGI